MKRRNLLLQLVEPFRREALRRIQVLLLEPALDLLRVELLLSLRRRWSAVDPEFQQLVDVEIGRLAGLLAGQTARLQPSDQPAPFAPACTEEPDVQR